MDLGIKGLFFKNCQGPIRANQALIDENKENMTLGGGKQLNISAVCIILCETSSQLE